MYRFFQCNVCAEPLPSGKRVDSRYCGVRCRVKAHRIRYDGRGLLDVEYHHYVDRVIKVEVAATDAVSDAAEAPAVGEEASMDADIEDSAVESSALVDEVSSIAVRADELARVSREALLEIQLRDANEQITALLAREDELYEVNAQLAAEMKAIEAQQQQMRESLSAAQAKLEKTTKQLADWQELARLLRESRDSYQSKLTLLERELRLAQQRMSAMSAKPPSPPSNPVQTPRSANDSLMQAQQRQIQSLTAQVSTLKAQLQQSAQAVEELAAYRKWATALRDQHQQIEKAISEVSSERNRYLADSQRLAAEVKDLKSRLANFEDGTWQTLLGGTLGLANGMLQAVAQSRNIQLPQVESASPAPAGHSQRKRPPMRKPRKIDVTQWRTVIESQRQNGWKPYADRLVIAKLSELHAAKVLAEAQQKAGRAVTVRLYPTEIEDSFAVQHAALNARMLHYLAHKDDPDEPSRASCRQMLYLLDEKSEAILFDRCRRRTRAYKAKLRRLTKGKRSQK